MTLAPHKIQTFYKNTNSDNDTQHNANKVQIYSKCAKKYTNSFTNADKNSNTDSDKNTDTRKEKVAPASFLG